MLLLLLLCISDKGINVHNLGGFFCTLSFKFIILFVYFPSSSLKIFFLWHFFLQQVNPCCVVSITSSSIVHCVHNGWSLDCDLSSVHWHFDNHRHHLIRPLSFWYYVASKQIYGCKFHFFNASMFATQCQTFPSCTLRPEVVSIVLVKTSPNVAISYCIYKTVGVGLHIHF